MTRILIADSCEEFRLGLTDLLQDRYFVRSCSDGSQAISLLDSLCPDLLIVDLMLQGVDGLTVMHAARRMQNYPPVLTTSIFYPDYAVNQFSELNVAYAVKKPCDLQSLAERIDDLVDNVCIPTLPVVTPHSAVTAALLELGMVPSRTGFQYIRDAIVMLSVNPSLRVTKDIYPVLAKRYRTGNTAVEKNIRDTIYALWRNADPQMLARYFLPASNGQIPRPSNHVFLSTMSELLFSVRKYG